MNWWNQGGIVSFSENFAYLLNEKSFIKREMAKSKWQKESIKNKCIAKLTRTFPRSVDCSLLFSRIYVVDGLNEPTTALSFEGLKK